MNRLFGMDSPLMVALMKIGDLLCLSVLWLVFSLPIFTIGASSTALYAAVFYCLRRNEAGVWKHFWKAFRENFKRSTLAWLIELAILALLAIANGIILLLTNRRRLKKQYEKQAKNSAKMVVKQRKS